MNHRKRRGGLGHNRSYRRCLIANMLKSLIGYGRIEITLAQAKELRRHADRLITLAKKGTLACRRDVIAKLMVRHNPLSSKEARMAKGGNLSPYNLDRLVERKLFDEIVPRFGERHGGYTRIVRTKRRRGDGSLQCVLEYLQGAQPVASEEA